LNSRDLEAWIGAYSLLRQSNLISQGPSIKGDAAQYADNYLRDNQLKYNWTAFDIMDMQEIIEQEGLSSDHSSFCYAIRRSRSSTRPRSLAYNLCIALSQSAPEELLTPFGVSQKDGVSMVYFKPQTPCVSHACDLLYKSLPVINPKTSLRTGTFHRDAIENVSKNDDALPGHETDGLSYFMDPTTGRTRDPIRYILRAIFGYFSNERERLNIPNSLLGQTGDD
jgi:hypothetical protein